jgi:ABC-type transporter Mla subunit MlaD
LQQAKRSIANIEGKVTNDLIPAAKAALESIPDVSRATVDSLNRTTEGLRPSFEALANGTASFAEAMADPRIKETLAHVEKSSENVERLTAESAATMGNVEDMSEDVKKAVHRWTSPGSTIKQAGLWALRIYAAVKP